MKILLLICRAKTDYAKPQRQKRRQEIGPGLGKTATYPEANMQSQTTWGLNPGSATNLPSMCPWERYLPCAQLSNL